MEGEPQAEVEAETELQGEEVTFKEEVESSHRMGSKSDAVAEGVGDGRKVAVDAEPSTKPSSVKPKSGEEFTGEGSIAVGEEV